MVNWIYSGIHEGITQLKPSFYLTSGFVVTISGRIGVDPRSSYRLNPMDQQLYVTTPEAAKLLHLSPRTLERRRSRGDGPRFHKAGRRVLYRIDEIEAWLSTNGFDSTSEY